jgi:hypothetical protein
LGTICFIEFAVLVRPLAKETNHGQLEAQSIPQNDDISLLVPFPSNHVESMKKIQRQVSQSLMGPLFRSIYFDTCIAN